jgi:hypothetical protein
MIGASAGRRSPCLRDVDPGASSTVPRQIRFRIPLRARPWPEHESQGLARAAERRCRLAADRGWRAWSRRHGFESSTGFERLCTLNFAGLIRAPASCDPTPTKWPVAPRAFWPAARPGREASIVVLTGRSSGPHSRRLAAGQPPRPAPPTRLATEPWRPACDERLRSKCWPARTGGRLRVMATVGHPLAVRHTLAAQSGARRMPPGAILDTARAGRAPSRSSGSGLTLSAGPLRSPPGKRPRRGHYVDYP